MKPKDFKWIEKFVLMAAIFLIVIGVAEIAISHIVKSVGLLADGIDSLSDAAVSLMVFFGLKLSRRTADKKFHFGYYRVETLASMLIAFVMIGMSLYIFYNAYLRLMHPSPLEYPFLGMITLVIAALISLVLAIIKNKIASKYNLLSLKADASASIKDCSSSFVILISAIFSYFGVHRADAIGALIVGVYIIFVAINIIQQASLVLMDGFNNPKLVKDITRIIKKHEMVELKEIKLRMSGPYITGRILILVDDNMTVKTVYKIKQKIREDITARIKGVRDLSIVADPDDD